MTKIVSNAVSALDAAGVMVLESGTGWVTLFKPCGVSVHNDPGADLVSLISCLLKEDPKALGQSSPDASVHAVHRLDGETSGVVLFAFGKEAARELTKQFESKTVRKRYTALCHGVMEAEEGIWDAPLAKESGGRNNPVGKGKKIHCETQFTVLERTERYTLVECSPLTGRKHQIRRHARLAGHPITGDSRYGSKRAIAVLTERLNYHRLSLHAFSLTFMPPGATREMTVATASVPGEMRALMDQDQP